MFKTLIGLTEISIFGSKLQKIPSGAEKQTQLIRLYLGYNEITEISYVVDPLYQYMII